MAPTLFAAAEKVALNRHYPRDHGRAANPRSYLARRRREPGVESALTATLVLRLKLLPGVDTRYGVGWGEVFRIDEHRRYVQDGPGWWAARSAIDVVKLSEGRSGHARRLRTRFVDHTGMDLPESGTAFGPRAVADALNSYLILRDELIGLQGPRDKQLTLQWLLGQTQAEIAENEGVTQSAISQRLGRSAAYAIKDAQSSLERLTLWIFSQ